MIFNLIWFIIIEVKKKNKQNQTRPAESQCHRSESDSLWKKLWSSSFLPNTVSINTEMLVVSPTRTLSSLHTHLTCHGHWKVKVIHSGREKPSHWNTCVPGWICLIKHDHHHHLLSGRSQRGGNHPDHPASAQSAPPLPAAPTEERGGVSAAGEGEAAL